MIEMIQIDGKKPIREIAALARKALAKRNPVCVTGFSSNQALLVELAGQLGTMKALMSGVGASTPVVGGNQSAAPGTAWFRSDATEYQRLVGIEPTVSLDYCVEPGSLIRWFTDMTELYPLYPTALLDPVRTAQATYSTHDVPQHGPLLRKTRLGGLPYAAITDSLIAIDGASVTDVDALKVAMQNLFGSGTREIYLDRAGDVLIHLSDGIAVGRMPGAAPQRGRWSHLTAEPDWDLLTQPF